VTEAAIAERGMRILRPLLLFAIAVSIVHYVDNTFNYDDFPQPTSGPAPSQGLVAFAWFFFTAFGIAGYLLLARARVTAAAIALAVYSGSGLVGIGHYLVKGATDMPAWRQAHVIADILCGIAMITLAFWLVRQERRTVSVPSPAR
jgi:uncharacterized membrane protein